MKSLCLEGPLTVSLVEHSFIGMLWLACFSSANQTQSNFYYGVQRGRGTLVVAPYSMPGMGNSSSRGSWLVSHFCPEDWSCPSLQYACTFSDWLHGQGVRSISYSWFLFQCLKQYVELLIKEGLETAISCPDSACPERGHLLENEVLFTKKCNCIICFRDICNSDIEGARA